MQQNFFCCPDKTFCCPNETFCLSNQNFIDIAKCFVGTTEEFCQDNKKSFVDLTKMFPQCMAIYSI